MAAQQYQNRDGVVVSAEQITDESDEYQGFWQITDKDTIVSRIPDDHFQRNFSPVSAQPAPARKQSEG